MGKTSNKQKLTPTVAGILATRIVEKIKEVNSKSKSGTKQQIQEDLSKDVDVLKGLKLIEELKKLNTKITQKFHKKWFNSGYQIGPFGTNPEIEKHVQDYKLKDKQPSEEKVKNDLLLESFFSEGVNPEQVIEQYVQKYTKK